ncbi:MAG: hypothetical protein H6581_29910 [Bacteroidia bacterium]|nr:hypothetical protein [Bacteroidia bacterium]
MINFDALHAAFPDGTAVTRIAPSPTGYLHAGHLLHLLYVSGLVRKLNAKVFLRVEDHDRQRCRPEFEAALLDDLDALGFPPSLTDPFRHGKCDFRQSDCTEAYDEAVEMLRKNGHPTYYCDCSRTSIVERTGQKEGIINYDGFCRDRGLGPGPDRGLRVLIPEKPVEFYDFRLGTQSRPAPRKSRDMLLRNRDGLWTYQFCVVVDDLRKGVNLVIRGMDILPSTAQQRLLAEMIAGSPPVFQYLHHPLVADATGRKLSKRDFDGDLHEKLAAGRTPAQLFGEALKAAGMWEGRPVELEEAQEIALANG